MPIFHKVQQGEYLAKIAAKYGFANGKSIWDHAKNAQLKQKRKSPNVLNPGDILFIPDKREKQQAEGTARSHTFEVPARTVLLCLVVKSYDDQPVINTKCRLEVDGDFYTLTTDSTGLIQQVIPRDAKQGKLTILEKVNHEKQEATVFLLKVGHLNPAEEVSGWQSRLRNLGYFSGSTDVPTDDADLLSAVEEFQCDHQLMVDGVCGLKTQAKLRQVHGC